MEENKTTLHNILSRTHAGTIKSNQSSGNATPVEQENVLRVRGYTLGKLLGEGSYAKVYLAEYVDKKTGVKQTLACKIINAHSAPKEFMEKFFPREVDILSKAVHQYIIKVHSVMQKRHRYYIFMQYAENGDLLEFIRAKGPVKERQSRIWFSQIIQGMKYLHDRNIAHRDMKCENLLLTAAFNIRITDFGFSRSCIDDKRQAVKSRTFCGSTAYAAPEIIRGIPYDCKIADIWSMGVVLYVMLNKSMPFDDSNLKHLYDLQMSRNWKFRSKVRETISNLVQRFIIKLLEPIPKNRKNLDELWKDPWIQNVGSDSAHQLSILNTSEANTAELGVNPVLSSRTQILDEGHSNASSGTAAASSTLASATAASQQRVEFLASQTRMEPAQISDTSGLSILVDHNKRNNSTLQSTSLAQPQPQQVNRAKSTKAVQVIDSRSTNSNHTIH